MMPTITPAAVQMWLETIDSIYRQELGRSATLAELGHYVDAILRLGADGHTIRAEVQALKPPPPAIVMPTREQFMANFRADLCMNEIEGGSYPDTGTWAVLGKSDLWWDKWYHLYRAHGHTVVPCSMVVSNYLGDNFDLTRDPVLLKERLARTLQAGLWPMLALNTVDGAGAGPDTLARLPGLLRAVRDVLPAGFLGWEWVVTGGDSLYTPAEGLAVMRIWREEMGPDRPLYVEFDADDSRTEPVIWDGRECPEPKRWWAETEARHLAGLLLRMPYCLLGDRYQFANEVGGALYRLQGAFPVPDKWPDGTPISDAHRANYRNDYGTHCHVVLFEWATAKKQSSDRKAQTRRWCQACFPTLTAFGDG